MEPQGYILTGLRKLRNGSHSPIILDLGETPPDIEKASERLPNFEHFHTFPATKAALKRVGKNAAFGSQAEPLVIDDFTVWPRAKARGGAIICTEQDYLFAKTIETVTGHVARAVRSIGSVLGRSKLRTISLNN